MLPDAPPDALDRLLRLPFVEGGTDGVVVHGAIQQAIAAALAATDPARHRELRRAAWRELRTEVAAAGSPDLWRFTADMLYLIGNPVVREAFFPFRRPAAQRGARPPIRRARRHGDRGGARAARRPDLLAQWWHE